MFGIKLGLCSRKSVQSSGLLEMAGVSSYMAFSCARKLSSSYSGSSMRVRRNSDNDELDIGFLPSGEVDTSSMATFGGSSSLFVTTLYDQSGNARNAEQTILDAQPVISSSGSFITDNSKLAMNFFPGRYLKTNHSDGILTEDFSSFCVLNSSASSSTNYAIYGYTSGSPEPWYLGQAEDGDNYWLFNSGLGEFTSNETLAINTNTILNFFINPANDLHGLYINDTYDLGITNSSPQSRLENLSIGGTNSGSLTWHNKIQEVIIFSVPSAAQREIILDNINSFYLTF